MYIYIYIYIFTYIHKACCLVWRKQCGNSFHREEGDPVHLCQTTRPYILEKNNLQCTDMAPCCISVTVIAPAPLLSKVQRLKYTELQPCLLFHMGVKLGISQYDDLGDQKDEVRGGLRKLRNEEIRDLKKRRSWQVSRNLKERNNFGSHRCKG